MLQYRALFKAKEKHISATQRAKHRSKMADFQYDNMCDFIVPTSKFIFTAPACVNITD